MNIKGKITKLFDSIEGRKDDKPWKLVSFLLEESVNHYPNKCKFTFIGEPNKIDSQMKSIFIGDEVDVLFTMKVSEFNGKYYQQLRVNSIKKISSSSLKQDDEDELPF